MNKKSNLFDSDKRNKIMLAVVLFVFFAILGMKLSVTYITDETGTMANAAFLAGYDWSNFIDNTGGYYYKYGQVLFWYPIFALVKDSIWIYKLIMLENAALLSIEAVCIYIILRKHLKIENKGQACLITAITTITPAAVLYSLFARADIILVAFSVYVLYFLMEAWYNRNDKKRQMGYTLLSVLCAVYSAMCHSRGIVWVIAVTMVVIVMHIWTKEKMVHYGVYVVSLSVFMLLDKVLTKYFKSSIWGEDGARHATVEVIDFEKLKMIFTPDGIKTMIKLVMGWLFNFMTSSMGLALLGIFAAFVVIWLFFFKKKDIRPEEAILCGYGFLTFAGSLALGVIFFFPYVYKVYCEGSAARADRLVYDRYLAGTISIAVLMGIYFIFYRKDIFKIISRCFIAASGIVTLLFFRKYVGPFLNNHEFSFRNSIASNLFVDNGGRGNDVDYLPNISGDMFKTGLFACIILIIVLVISWTKWKKAALTGILCVFGISLLANYVKLRLNCDLNVVEKMQPLYEYSKEIPEISEKNRYIYVDKSAKRYKPMQLLFKEYGMYIRKHTPEGELDNYFIISKPNDFKEKLNEDDCYILTDFDYNDSEYVIYVKGEELKEELEQNGKVLEKYLSE